MTAVRMESATLDLPWWTLLISAVFWLIYGFVVLSFNEPTVWAITIMAGVLFFCMGVIEIFVATIVPGWKWLHVIVGILAIVAGIVAFAWPDQTFLTLAHLVGWLLMIRGAFDIGTALATRDVYQWWWLTLVAGIFEIVIGVWAVGYVGRSIALLVLWVGIASLARGLTHLFLAFDIKSAQESRVS